MEFPEFLLAASGRHVRLLVLGHQTPHSQHGCLLPSLACVVRVGPRRRHRSYARRAGASRPSAWHRRAAASGGRLVALRLKEEASLLQHLQFGVAGTAPGQGGGQVVVLAHILGTLLVHGALQICEHALLVAHMALQLCAGFGEGLLGMRPRVRLQSFKEGITAFAEPAEEAADAGTDHSSVEGRPPELDAGWTASSDAVAAANEAEKQAAAAVSDAKAEAEAAKSPQAPRRGQTSHG
ncbi:hypothetical protein AB0911_37270 [Streptomyces nigra]|uniref:hypothetical protein n=1 Tax=Streptomyces nigra TaxID=1827580 RepID=UPI003453EA45